MLALRIEAESGWMTSTGFGPQAATVKAAASAAARKIFISAHPPSGPACGARGAPHGTPQGFDNSYISLTEGRKVRASGPAREAERLIAKKIKTSLAPRFAMIHLPSRHNKRKEVIRCLMVQQ
jgi:hypothetical protein